MIDGDFLMEDPNTLLTLIQSRYHIVAPWYDQDDVNPGAYERVQYPMIESGQGIIPIKWISTNCLLFDSLVFRIAGTQIFSGEMVTNHEDYIFLQLRNYGIKLWQNTSVQVKMLRKP